MDEAGFEYRFYTNGSILDNNALHYFVREYGIEEEKCIFPHTTREVVSAVSTFDAAVTFRMHSSIIAYSFSVPSVSLVWNDKIPFFYKKTGYPDRALDFDKWDAAYVFDLLKKSIDDKPKPQQTDEYSEYLMTVYRFLYRTLSDFLDKEYLTALEYIIPFQVLAHLTAMDLGLSTIYSYREIFYPDLEKVKIRIDE